MAENGSFLLLHSTLKERIIQSEIQLYILLYDPKTACFQTSYNPFLKAFNSNITHLKFFHQLIVRHASPWLIGTRHE